MCERHVLTEKVKRNLLLKEYELCQNSAQSLESTIWQTSTAVGIGSVGTLVLVANIRPDWQVVAIIGGLVTATAFIWWYMAKRWWSIEHAKFLRMRHIEEDLKMMYQVRYIQYLDNPRQLVTSGLSMERQHELKHFDNYQRTGVQGVLRFLPYLVLTTWVLFTVALLLSEPCGR